MKSLFLGPKAENIAWLLEQMVSLTNEYSLWRKKLYPNDGAAISHFDQSLSAFTTKQALVKKNLLNITKRYEKEVPQFSPRYIGHMFSEVNLPAVLGHFLSLLHNPNIISHESAKVGIEIENEAVIMLNRMIGYRGNCGHFTSGGTVANFESLVRSKERIYWWALMLAVEKKLYQTQANLWQASTLGWDRFYRLMKDKKIARQFEQGLVQLKSHEQKKSFFADIFNVKENDPVVLIPNHKHYSWIKGCALIGLNESQIIELELDETGKIHTKKFELLLEKLKNESRPIQQIVAVLGTTELGFVDPVHRLISILKTHQLENAWLHVDAAYGGFFASLKRDKKIFSPETFKALNSLKHTTSLTIDPHKMAYVPYASGTFLCSDKNNYYLQSFFGPYVAFNQKTDRGPFTLEGSRSATGVTAMWMTAKSMPLNQNGLGRIIKRTLRTKKDIEILLKRKLPMVRLAPDTDLNILCFCVASQDDSLSAINKKTSRVLKYFEKNKEPIFIFSQTKLQFKKYGSYMEKLAAQWGGLGKIKPNEDLLLVRITLMNPFFDSKEFHVNFKLELVKQIEKSISLVINAKNK
ncbi:MAG: pyridoxal-dependent decarboxylase [Bdellovibrionaceae bacterium]|nr:pyridoxal-dependent decarboxylase [Pseudobdellovibrionaceae bacterium]